MVKEWSCLRYIFIYFIGQRYLCTTEGCNYQTIYKRALQSHIGTVHLAVKRKSYQCHNCTFTSTDKHLLTNHIKEHKTIDQEKYQCNNCDYSASKHSYLRSHMLTHVQTHKYQCNRCTFSSSRANNLRIHLMSHFGVRPWKCDKCSYTSITKQKAERHNKKIHSGTASVIKEAVKMNIDIDTYRTKDND